MKRKTIAKEIEYIGIGLHKGENIKMRLLPSENGIIFKRVDLEEGKNEITLDIANTFDLTRGTNLQNEYGAKVHTIEHFLSALYALDITDLVVELDGNELPICDGSARVFIEIFEEAGLKELDSEVEPLVVKEPIYLTLDNAIVIKKDGVLNPSGLRFEDEFVRHKMLDIIGDLKILNRPIRAHIIAIKAGHALDIEFAKLLKNM